MTTGRQLYSSPLSSNARRTVVVAAHLGIDVELVPVRLGDPAARSRLAAINPNHKIPVLVEGDFVLWESNAINAYFCDLVPGQTLLPAAPREKADVLRWLFWQAAHLSPACGGFNFEHIVKKMMGTGEPDPVALAGHAAAFHQFAKVIDRHLATHRWLANEALSLADYALAATLLHAVPALYPIEAYEHLRGHVARVHDLPAWRQSEVTP